MVISTLIYRLKTRLYNLYNLNGWKIECFYCKEEDLDINEKKAISFYANKGYQLRNKTAGGQGKGKIGIAENRACKGYYDGLKQGYKNAQKEISKLFNKNLSFSINGKLNKNKEKALDKFIKFLGGGGYETKP